MILMIMLLMVMFMMYMYIYMDTTRREEVTPPQPED